jgi:hypothetical protein
MKKSMNILDEFDALIKAADPKTKKGLPFPPPNARKAPGNGKGKVIGRTADGKEVYAMDPTADADPLRKKKPGQDDEEEQSEPGTTDHHKDRALAHLQAAQAHASAASSAKKVEEGADHKEAVSAAQEASEATMVEDQEKKKPAFTMTKGGLPVDLCSADDACLDILEKGDVLGRQVEAMPDVFGPERLAAMRGERLVKGGGEGSRGGKIVGHTASGKPIYGSSGNDHADRHYGHADEHRDMTMHHKKQKEGYQYADLKGSGKARGMHSVAAKTHEAADAAHREAIHGDPEKVKRAHKLSISAARATMQVEAHEASNNLGQTAKKSLTKSANHVAGGTIHQGEYDRQGSREGDYREEYMRAVSLQETVQLDHDKTQGNGGLPEWFRDSWNQNSADPVNVPLNMPAQRTGILKAVDSPMVIIDDSTARGRALFGGRPGERNGASIAFDGDPKQKLR